MTGHTGIRDRFVGKQGLIELHLSTSDDSRIGHVGCLGDLFESFSLKVRRRAIPFINGPQADQAESYPRSFIRD